MSGKREKINSGLLEMFKTFPAFNYNIYLSLGIILDWIKLNFSCVFLCSVSKSNYCLD